MFLLVRVAVRAGERVRRYGIREVSAFCARKGEGGGCDWISPVLSTG